MPKPNSDFLSWNNPIVDPKTGFPTDDFMRQFSVTKEFNGQLSSLFSLELIAGTGLDGGGVLGDFNNITLTLEDTAVAPGSYTNANITVDQQGRLTAASSGAPGAAWTLAGSWDFGVSGNTASPIAFTGLAGANELLVVGRGLTGSVNGSMGLHVSVDNGANYFTTNGDYAQQSSSGQDSTNTNVPLSTDSTTAARGWNVEIVNPALPVTVFWTSGQIQPSVFLASANDIDAIRVFRSGGGNFTGGTIKVYKR